MMKNIINFFRSKKGTVVLALVAFTLLLGSAAGSTNAALTYYSEDYVARMELTQIGVTLVEDCNGQGNKEISYRNYADNGNWTEETGKLLENMLDATNGKLLVNTSYSEKLSVKNSGDIDTYVRMRVYRYWTDAEDNKTTDLSPELIKLHVAENSGWVQGESTVERMYFYWPTILEKGETTNPTIDAIEIDGAVSKNVTTVKNSDGSWKTTYDYNGYKFVLEAEVDAVQTHNYKDAIKSAWGVSADYITEGEE